MSIDLHTISLVKGTKLAFSDRLKLGLKFGIANAAGGSAGASVTVAVAFAGELPANYLVFAEVGADVTYNITGKTPTGFNVVLSPRLAANTLAAGTFNVGVMA